MKRKNVIRSLIVIFLISLTLGSLFSVINADDSAALGAVAPGGTVDSLEKLIEALGADNVKLSSDSTVVYLSKNIILNAPIDIVSGTYKIVGRGHTIYRGFVDGALFQLTTNALSDKDGNPIDLPVLILGKEIKLEDQDLEDPDLILDGNSQAFKEEVNGSLIALLGKATLTVNPGVIMTNNHSCAPGGAIYLESFGLGTEVSPLDPTLNITGGEIS